MIYLSLKSQFPNLPIFASIQIDEYNKDARQAEGLQYLMASTDLIAISSYAFGHGYRPFSIPANYFTAVRALAPSKPFAIAETGWPAEPVRYPEPLPAGQTYAYDIYSNSMEQQIYLERILQEATTNNAKFINWFVVRDYDLAWEKEKQFSPLAYLIRFWRDIGLLNGKGQARMSFTTWTKRLALPRQ
jgi:hypothetical protein